MHASASVSDSAGGDTGEYLMLDFGRKEPVHRWTKLQDCQEFVGSKRSKHTMVAYKDALYVFGGDNGRMMLNDLLRFDIKEQSWSRAITTGTLPTPRYHHTAVVYGDFMLIFGGYTGDIHSNSNLTNKNDLHEYKFNSGHWSEWKVEGRQPDARSAHGAVVYNNQLWVFAGYDGNTRLNDMWYLSLRGDTRAWNKVNQTGSIPPTSCNFGITVARKCMYLFSGQSGAKTTNDIYQFDFEEKSWLKITTDHILQGGLPPPEKRFGHIMVAFDRHLYVLGGAIGTDAKHDLHCFDLDTKTWSTIDPTLDSEVPPGRVFHAAAVINDALYIYGGATVSNVRNGEIYRFQFSSYPRCTLKDDFGKLLRNQQFCDLQFNVVDGETKETIKCHCCIVAARSQWLRNRIQQAKKQNQVVDGLLQVTLLEASPDAFKLVLSYIYTDTIKPTDYQVPGDEVLVLMMKVYRLAVQFDMNRLKQLCCYFLENSVNNNNVTYALLNADDLQVAFLKEYCLKYIVRPPNYGLLVNSDTITTLDKDLLIEIMRRQFLLQHQSNNNSAGLTIVKPAPEPTAGDMIYITNSLERDMQVFLNDVGSEFTDVTLMLGDHAEPAHLAVLAARSGYFEAQFRSFPPKDGKVKIAIGEMVPSKQAFRSLLRYIYYSDVTMPPEDSLYLFSAPFYFGFSNNRLQAYCKDNLEMNVSPDNVIEILEVADKIQATDMKKHSLHIIVQHFKKVARSPKLATLNRELLLDIIYEIAGDRAVTASDLVTLNFELQT